MISKNDVIDVLIDDLGKDGEGIAHYENQTIFIPNAITGEKVKIRVIFAKKGIFFGKILEIITKSENRIPAKCKYFYECGGCDLQYINYNEQLNFKTGLVKNTFKKIARVDFNINNTIASNNIFNYRNKLAFPVNKINNKTIIGMYKKNSHDIVEIKDCVIQKEFAKKILLAFNEYFEIFNNGIDQQNLPASIKHIVAREHENQILICVVANSYSIKGTDTLIEILKKYFDNFGLSICLNTLNNNVILTNHIKTIYGNSVLNINEFDIDYPVSINSFLQVNDDIKNKIYSYVLENIEQNETVIDAYSGTGLLTSIVSKKAKNVFGIEIIKDAIENANDLLKNNKINNCQNICGDCLTELPKLISTITDSCTIILDPPRSGCDKKVMEELANSKNINKIIYISCSPQTLSRDVSYLLDNYEILSIQPFDMFPQTKHIETVCLLKSLKK